MKAIKKGIFLLLVILGSPSCVKENLDDCPEPDPYNLVLSFEYFDKTGKDIFADRIQAIDVLIYDRNYHLYKEINADDVLEHPQRTKSLYVEPGVYYIVSWANNFTNRFYMAGVSKDNLLLGENRIYHNFSSESADELHYAPDLRAVGQETEIPDDYSIYRVTVADTGITYHTLSYMSAHRRVNVFLRGFDEVTSPETDNPFVHIANLTDYYNCYLKRGEESTRYQKISEEILVEEKNLGYAGFYVPHFDNQSPVTLQVVGQTPEGASYLHRVTMDEVLRELELVVEDGDDETINVVIELIDNTYVVVKIPEWLTEEVDGEYN